MAALLSVIVRTMPGREDLLDEALFSLALQEYGPIQAVVTAHTRAGQGVAPLQDICQRYAHELDLAFVSHCTEGDARSRSLNIGLARAEGRYVAFLDDDDVVYPPHYRILLGAIESSGCAWAYSQTIRATYRRIGSVLQPVGRSPHPGSGPYSFVRHLHDNFIPLHSFAVDRAGGSGPCSFDESLSRLEDYDFLLRLASRHPPAYVPLATCEYRIRTDGTNTVIDGTHGAKALVKEQAWDAARREMAIRKLDLVGWWLPEVVGGGTAPAAMHPETNPQAAAAQRMVDDYWDSTSWRVTSSLRRIAQMFRRQPRERRPIVGGVAEAERVVAAIRGSTSWRVTSPVRWVGRLLLGL